MRLFKKFFTKSLVMLLLFTSVTFQMNLNASNFKTMPLANIHPTFNSNPLFKFESIQGKFNLATAEFENCTAIFRNDRIEFLYRNDKNKEASTYLLFPKGVEAIAEGNGLQSSTTEKIQNEAMAAVMGTNSMDITYYEQIIYPNIYPGTNLIVKRNKDNNLEIVLEGRITDFSLKPLDSTIQKDFNRNQFKLNRTGATIDIIPIHAKMKWSDSDNIQFSQKDQVPISFEISVK